MRMLGPYTHRTGSLAGRRFVLLVDGSRKTTMLYSRWLMQEHLGWTLDRSEHVHHINEDFTDDRIENLEIKSASRHSHDHALGRPSPAKGIERGWSHGTMYGWQTKKCECVECAEAKGSYRRNRPETVSQRGPYRKRYDYEHGTRSMYRIGCRCDKCREGNAARARKLRESKK